MAVIQFLEHLLHDGLAEKCRLGTDSEFLAIQSYGSHFTVIKMDDLSVSAHKSLFLLLEVFRIYSRDVFLLFSLHFFNELRPVGGL